MVIKNVTSHSQSGLRDWLLQRVTAIVLAAFVFCLLGFWFVHSPLTYVAWHGLFSGLLMRVFAVMALLSLLIHARIGIWTVLTDYVKPYCLRLFLQVVVLVGLVGFLIWGLHILW